MKSIWNSAFGLLLVTGIFFGVALPFGKVAMQAGVPALLWAFVMAFGSGVVLSAVLLISGGRPTLSLRKLRYYLIAAAISFAYPNYLMFAAVPHLGAGYTSIMVTLSPVFTLVFSIAFGVRRPNLLGVVEIAVGFVGAVMVAATRGEVGQPAEIAWVLAGFFIPVCLAAGNVYRTIDWPADAGPIELAAGCNLAAAVMLLVALLFSAGPSSFGTLSEVPLLAAAQVAASSAMFAFYFRLQVVGGPVYLSQIGYVGAAIGLGAGIVLLGERYLPLTWLGTLLIAVGVALTTAAQKKKG
jgi:drug/metabolite transporter (DMT)-like permease